MDVYYVMTNYHLLSALLHKINCNDNDSIIIVSSFLLHKQPYLINNLKQSGLFKDVIAFDEIDVDSTIKDFNSKKEKEEIERLSKYAECEIGSLLKNAKNLYICSDFYSIGFYLIKNKIKYNYFEDGCGILSRRYMPLLVIEKGNSNRAQIVKKLGCFGENKNVIKRFGSLSDQEEGYKNPKDVDFSVKALLKKMSKKDIDKLLKIYEVDNINIKNQKVVLLLTMHYNELMSIDKQKDIYTSLLDYFVDDKEKVVIKPHPADTIYDYENIFKDIILINRYMPSEFFPYCINSKFESGITCWSTSIYGLKGIIKNIIDFNIEIDETYVDFDKYYSVVEYLNSIKKKEKVNIVYKNVNSIQFKRLFERYFKDYEKYYTFNENKKNSIFIVDKITDDILNERVISMEYDLNANNYILIDKKSSRNKEQIFVSIYNSSDSKKINILKKLKYSNSEVSITNINNKKHKEILIEATVKNAEKIIKYEKEIARLKKQMNIKNEEMERIFQSKSWKITKPLRKIMRFFRKK